MNRAHAPRGTYAQFFSDVDLVFFFGGGGGAACFFSGCGMRVNQFILLLLLRMWMVSLGKG